jgi:predicted AAA+ superfamily ATPase
MMEPDRAYISLDESAYLQAAQSDPISFIAELPDYVTIDEVQRAPELFLAIKRSVDTDRRPGRFLLTGSANLLQLPRLADSLAGRMECLYLHPLSAAEAANAPGRFLDKWLGGTLETKIEATGRLHPSELPDRLLAGGYPEPRTRTPRRARQWYRNYIKSIIERDIHDVAEVKAGADVARLLELLAHRTGQLLNVASLAKEVQLDRETVERYLSILEKLFLVRRLPAWHRNSAKRLIKAPKLHVCDSGLCGTLAELRAEEWIVKRHSFGHLLESAILQELIAQSSWTDPDLRFWHYRDKDQVEVDCVITRGQQVWGVEIKASATVGRSDTKGLRRLAANSGQDFQAGIVFYDGQSCLPLGDSKYWAVPISKLWEL